MAYDHDLDLSFVGAQSHLVEDCAEELAASGIRINLERTSIFLHDTKIGDLEAWWPHRPGHLCRSHPDERDSLILRWMLPTTDDFPAGWIDPLWSIELDGEMFPCPHEPQRLLQKRFPTCRLHMRFCFPHKQRCWTCAGFWREAWRIWTFRGAPVTDPRPYQPGRRQL
jgi:hypothetical protein